DRICQITTSILQACQRTIDRRIRISHGDSILINWNNYVWKHYALAHKGRRLRNMNDRLSDLGILDGDKLEFLKILRNK
ncbi:hypothetical protein GJ496_006448, partial [Pomphorhynchus laevis]